MWNEAIKDWDNGFFGFLEALKKEEDKFRLILMALNRLPNWLAPFDYYGALKKYGGETWWNPSNLWRQLFHALAATPFCLLYFVPPYLFPTIVALVFSALHEWSDMKQSFANFRVKNLVDVLFWAGGASLATFLGNQLI